MEEGLPERVDFGVDRGVAGVEQVELQIAFGIAGAVGLFGFLDEGERGGGVGVFLVVAANDE